MIGSDSISLLFRMRGDSSDAQKASNELRQKLHSDVNAAEKDFDRFGGAANKTSSALAGFAGGIAALAVSALTGALVSGAKSLLDYSARMEQTKIAFTSLIGNAEKANKHLADLRKFAVDTPFEFEGLAKASQRLQGANVELEKIIPLMTSIGNIVSATGETSEERLNGITTAISQMIGKTKVSAEEMEQLSERGVQGWAILSEATGKTQAELRKLSEQGKLSSDVMVAALQKIGREKFGDAMEKQSKTFNGAMSSIKDILTQTAATAFEPLFKKISEVATRTASEIQGADLSRATQIMAKNLARGFGQYLEEELRREAQTVDVYDVYTSLGFKIGESFGEGFLRGWNIIDAITGNLKDPEKFRKILEDTKNLPNTIQGIISKGGQPQAPTNTGLVPVNPIVDTQKEAEKARKELADRNKREFAATIEDWKLYAAEVAKGFDKAFAKLQERLKETGNAAEFRKNTDDLIRWYKEKIEEADKTLKTLEEARADRDKQTEGERKLLQRQQDARTEEWKEKRIRAEEEVEQAIAESAKKQAEKVSSAVEKAAQKRIDLKKAEIEQDTKLNEQRLINSDITESDLTVIKSQNAKNFLDFQIQVNKELANDERLTAETRAEIQDRLLILTTEQKTAEIELSIKRAEALKAETAAMRELMGAQVSGSAGERAGAPPSETEVFGSQEEAENPLFSGWLDQWRAFIDEVLELSIGYENIVNQMGSLSVNFFGNMAQAVGSAMEAWALYGESIGKALRKALAAELAHIAGVATVNAVYATALGFLRLAQWDFAAAGNAFVSAGIWASIAGVTALAAKGIAGNSFRQETQGAFGTAGQSTGGNRSTPENGSATVIDLGRNTPFGRGESVVERFAQKVEHNLNLKLKIEFEDFKVRVLETVADGLGRGGDFRDKFEEAVAGVT